MLNHEFEPDLIVEVTNVCDRACKGCYANNLVSSLSKEEVFEKFPSLFLRSPDLQSIFTTLPASPKTVAFRGGEPTLHPSLHQILVNARNAGVGQLFLETHGRWLLTDGHDLLIDAIISTGTIVKISFDGMHQISPRSLKRMTDKLQKLGIDYRIAVTEKSLDKFNQTKSICPWIDESKFVFQLLATHVSELPQPWLGVVNCFGKINDSVNIKESFRASV